MYWLVSNADDCDDFYNTVTSAILIQTSPSAWFTASFRSIGGISIFQSLNFINTHSLHLIYTAPPHPQGVISDHKPIVPSRIERFFCSSLTLNENRSPNHTLKLI